MIEKATIEDAKRRPKICTKKPSQPCFGRVLLKRGVRYSVAFSTLPTALLLLALSAIPNATNKQTTAFIFAHLVARLAILLVQEQQLW